MSFDEIPEDKLQSYPCRSCGVGNIVDSQSMNEWRCDTCEWPDNECPECGTLNDSHHSAACVDKRSKGDA